MHGVRNKATDVLVAWCVRLSVTRLRPAKTTRGIEVLFGVKTPVGSIGTLCLMEMPIPYGGGEDRSRFDHRHITLATCYTSSMLVR